MQCILSLMRMGKLILPCDPGDGGIDGFDFGWLEGFGLILVFCVTCLKIV